MAHPAHAYPKFCSAKWQGVLLLPPECSPSQDTLRPPIGHKEDKNQDKFQTKASFLPAELTDKPAISCTTQQARNKQTTRNTCSICPTCQEVETNKKNSQRCQTEGTWWRKKRKTFSGYYLRSSMLVVRVIYYGQYMLVQAARNIVRVIQGWFFICCNLNS